MDLSEFVKAWSLGFRLQPGVPDHSNLYLRGLSVKAGTGGSPETALTMGGQPTALG